MKEQGNVEYRAGNYQRAAELYTSAILQYDEDQVLDTFSPESSLYMEIFIRRVVFLKLGMPLILLAVP